MFLSLENNFVLHILIQNIYALCDNSKETRKERVLLLLACINNAVLALLCDLSYILPLYIIRNIYLYIDICTLVTHRHIQGRPRASLKLDVIYFSLPASYVVVYVARFLRSEKAFAVICVLFIAIYLFLINLKIIKTSFWSFYAFILFHLKN